MQYIATIFMFARFVKDILGETIFFVKKKTHYNSKINIFSSRQWEVFGKKIILKSFIKMLKITLRGEDHFILVKSQTLRLQIF